MKFLRSFWPNVQQLRTTLTRVVQLAWNVSPALYVAQLILNVLSGLFPLVTAFLAGAVVTKLTQALAHHGSGLGSVYRYIIVLAVIQLVSNQLSYLESYLDDLYGLKFDGYIWEQLLHQFGRLDQTYYDDTAFNNQLNKITQNIYAMRSLSNQSFSLLSSVVQIVATAIALSTLEPWLVPVILLALAPVIAIETSASFKRWRYWDRRGENFRMQWYLRNTLTDINKIREIKLYGLSDWLTKRWRDHFETARQGQITIERQAQRQRAAAGVLDAIVQVSIQIWLIALVVGRGLAGIGQFVFYRQAVQNFATAGSSGVRMLHQMQENSLYVNDYFEFLTLKPRLRESLHPVKLRGTTPPRIEFENVSFRYPGAAGWALRHLDLTIEPGQDIAIIGENGAGKTTLVKLLMRLYDPTEGQILIDGVSLPELDLNSWSKRIGVLFQDFNKYGPLSLRENIQTGKITQTANTELITGALLRAGGQELMDDLSGGLDQRLTNSYEGGVDLSGGQWQRVALGRAFYRDAPILVLDEPTSAIDARGEYEIFQQIAKTKQNKTTIIISHRFSTVRNADRIVVLKNGRMSEQGTHDELVAEAGDYKRLFDLQAAGYR